MRRTQRFLRWAWPLLALVGTISVVWRCYFQAQAVTPKQDPWVPVGIGVAYLIALAFILGTTESWSLRGLGQVATYVADAGLYLGLGLPMYGHWHAFTPGELNLIRACLAVGGTFLVLGLVWWRVSSWRESRARPEPTPWVGGAIAAPEMEA